MRWFKIITVLSAFTLCLSPGTAQEVKKPAKEKSDDCYAYSVMVYPKSGNKYEAIVLDKAFVDHFKANETLDPKKFAPDTRVTLHYMRGMNGSMGIKLKDVISIARLAPLSKEDYGDVKNVVGKRIKKLNEQETVRIEKQKAKRTEERKERAALQEKARLAKEAKAHKNAELDRFPLIKRFPPEKGWSKAMKEEIWRRKIIIKVFPKPEEQYFMDHFDEWEEQFKAWKALQEKEKKGAEAPAVKEQEKK